MKEIDIITNKDGHYEGDLINYFKIIFFEHRLRNPYHNLSHILHVMRSAYDGALFEGLDRLHIKPLLIAALFHDLGHKDDGKPDHENILRSIRLMHYFQMPQDSVYSDEIEEYISATEYPHKEMKLSQGALILRDADMSQILDPNWLQQSIVGFSQVWKRAPAAVLLSEVKFLIDLKFHSEWGKQVLQPRVYKRMADVEGMISILDLS